jgi:conjugative transfer region protein TrbK
MRPFAPKSVGRIAATIALVAAIVAGVVALEDRPPGSSPAPRGPTDTLDAALDRCHALGSGAAEDPFCAATRQRLHDHFFDREPGEMRP